MQKKNIIQNFNRRVASADTTTSLTQEMGRRLFERLDFMRLQPKNILDLGAGLGYFSKLLEKRYRKATIFAVDFAENRMQFARKKNQRWFGREKFLCADADYLPFQKNSFDLVFANLLLPWCQNSQQTLQQIQRVLKPEGLLLFSTLGPDTLQELRKSWQQVDNYSHVNTFVDMHHIGDQLVQVNLADPVMDMEYLTFTYKNLPTLFQDLKMVGMSNISENRLRGLMGKQHWQKFLEQYQLLASQRSDGLFPATFEVVYGHAWGSNVISNQIDVATGEVRISLNDIHKLSK